MPQTQRIDCVVDYSTTLTPHDYRCKDCGMGGVRLYRLYQTFLENQELRCTKCARENQRNPDGTLPGLIPPAHSIGWLVAAVPTEDNETYWGFTSVPDAGVKWWNALPVSR